MPRKQLRVGEPSSRQTRTHPNISNEWPLLTLKRTTTAQILFMANLSTPPLKIDFLTWNAPMTTESPRSIVSKVPNSIRQTKTPKPQVQQSVWPRNPTALRRAQQQQVSAHLDDVSLPRLFVPGTAVCTCRRSHKSQGAAVVHGFILSLSEISRHKQCPT